MAEPTTDRKTIRQKIIKKLYAGKYPIVSVTTSIAGDKISIVDNMFAPSAQVEDYNSVFVYIAEAVDTPATGPAVGEVARVINTDFGGTNSILITAPTFTAKVNTGTDYEMHYNFHPQEINERIEEILSNIRGWMFIPISGLLKDGSFDQRITLATNWNDSDTMTTVVNTTSAYILFGDGSLKISASTAAGDYVYQRAFVSAGTPLMASVYAFVDSEASTPGDIAEMEVWDVTNGVQIGESCNTSTFNQWVQLTTQLTVPGTCKQVEFRLLSSGTGGNGTVYYDSASLLERDQRTHDLPVEFDGPEDMQLVEYFPRGDKIVVGTSLNAYRVLQYPAEKWSDFEILRDPRGATPTRIQLIQNRRDRVGSYYTSSRATPSWSSRSRVGNDIDHPLFFRGRADYPSVETGVAATDDATTIYAPEDYVVNLVLADLFEEMALQDLDEEKHDAYTTKMDKARDVREKIAFLARTNSDDRVTVRGTFNAK